MTTTASSHTSVPVDVTAVRPFSDLSVDDIAYAGGKGANLGQLTRAGLPVPPGFVVGAPAYGAFLAETGLGQRLSDLLTGLDVEDTEALRAGATAARRAVTDSEMPEWLAESIGQAYDQL